MRAIPSQAIDFIADHEGFRDTAYQDSAGVWTIAYGHIDGVKQGDTCTQEQGKAWLLLEAQTKAAVPLAQRIGAIVDDLTENQYSALLSFVFNMGAGVSWTIWKRLRAKQYDQVPGELTKFVNADGQKIQGLVNRRADEIKLWSTDEPGSTAQVIPSSVTRVAATPPTPADPVPPQKSVGLIAGGLAACGMVPTAAKTVIDTVSPWQASAPILIHIIQVAGVAGAAAAIVALVLNFLSKRSARG